MRVNRLLWLLITLLFMIACNKQVDYIGTTSPSENPYVSQTDTFEAVGTIYRPDSFKTAAKGYVYAGFHSDSIFGLIACNPFVRFSLPSIIPEPANNSFYDSVVLILHAANTYYGDTNSIINLGVYELAEDMTNSDNNVFYNNQSFTSVSNSLGNKTTIIRPGTNDSVRIKLRDDFGQTLFDLFKVKSSTIKDSAIFKTIYKGLSLKAATNGNVIYSFPTKDSSFYMRIYYHDDIGKPDKKQIDFTVKQFAYAFTNISVNRSGTPLAALNSVTEIPVTNMIVDNELTQVRTRFSFPGFSDIQKLGSFVKIINANLEIKPVANRYTSFYQYPREINLYQYGFSTALDGPMTNGSGQTAQTGNLYIDDSYGRDTRYSFDVTSYLNTELTATSYTTKKLVAIIPGTETNLSSLVAGSSTNQQYRSKLILSVLVNNDN